MWERALIFLQTIWHVLTFFATLDFVLGGGGRLFDYVTVPGFVLGILWFGSLCFLGPRLSRRFGVGRFVFASVVILGLVAMAVGVVAAMSSIP
jgi:hypothetical protein